MPLTIRRSFIPAVNANRPGVVVNTMGTSPGTLLTKAPLYIIVHETGNTRVGMGAEAHRGFTHGGGGPFKVSFHFTVDDHEAIQLLPLNEVGWHAADGCDNRQTDIGCFQGVAIETCVNSDGDWNKTFANLAELIADIIEGDDRIDFVDRKGQFSIDRIKTHKEVSDTNKDCPHKILAGSLWDDLLAAVKANLVPGVPIFSIGLDGMPSEATLNTWFGTLRPYSPEGPVSKAWKSWCLGSGLWPKLTAVSELTLPSGTGTKYDFEGNLTIVWDGTAAWVVGQKPKAA